jgi:cohesin complex subunit SA-1/2
LTLLATFHLFALIGHATTILSATLQLTTKKPFGISIATNASMTTRRTPLMDISNNDVTSSPVATGSRRKSGRAVKVPEKFVPDAPSSQPGLASAKRKRGGENAENDASDIEDIEEELDDSEGTIESAGEEELKETRRKTTKARRKPAAKKPKINGSASHEVAAAVKLPSRAKKPKKVAIADKSAEGLYGKRVCFRKI